MISVDLSKTIRYLAIFWLIIISGVITVGKGQNEFLFFLIGSLLIVVLLLSLRSNEYLFCNKLKVTTIILCFIAFVQLLLEIINGHIWYGSLKMIIIFLLCYLLVVKIDFHFFASAFCDIIFFVALISIVLYWFNSQIVSLSFLPTVSVGSTQYTNLYVYCVGHYMTHRNTGIFWEPGAFQVFLNLALMMSLYCSNMKHRTLKILVYSIALLTTISTTGWVAYGLILISFFLLSYSQNKSKKYLVFVLLLCIFIGLSQVLLPIFENSINYKFGLGNGYSELSTNVTSRVNPFLLDLKIIMKHPFGIMGVDCYKEVLDQFSLLYNVPFISSSCTPTIVAVSFGVLPGCFLLFHTLSFSRVLTKNRLQRVLLGITIVIIFTTESFLLYGLYYYIGFSSIFIRENRICIGDE